jgi:Zn-dependent M28 family amino/carboxypeptidase
MKNLVCLGFAAALVSACSDTSGHSQSGEISEYTLNVTALSEHIKILASDEFGGRAPGSLGEDLTVAYLSKTFAEAGLAPANGESYAQQVPLVSITAEGNPSLNISGQGQSFDLDYRSDQVVWTRRQENSSSVADSDLVFVGYGINAPERGWNDYEGIDVRGKTVVMLINDPGYATQNPELFSGNTMTYYGRWDYKFDEASRQGAAGAIIIHETKAAAYGWPTVDASWTGAQFDTVRADGGEGLAGFEAWITNESAEKLFAASGMDLNVLSSAATKPDFKAVPMPLKASVDITNEVTTVQSRNVAGILRGSEASEEVFVYMAHWDHIGTNPTANGDGIYNGALDNATGTAALIELAKSFTTMDEKPKRSILFLAVTAEEQGLLGSAYYAANPLVPLAQTVGGINMDGLNIIGRTKDVTVIGLGNSELDGYLERAAKKQNRVLVADQEPEKGYFYRSDHFELSKLGVPMLYPNAGYDHRELGREYGDAKAAEYIKKHYHGPSDEYNPDWDLSGAIEDLELYKTTGLMVINSGDWPNWNEGTEFKAARDKQRANK